MVHSERLSTHRLLCHFIEMDKGPQKTYKLFRFFYIKYDILFNKIRMFIEKF